MLNDFSFNVLNFKQIMIGEKAADMIKDTWLSADELTLMKAKNTHSTEL